MLNALLEDLVVNREHVLTFLRQHQPLPSDDRLTEELIAQYRQALDYCRASRDVECIPLLLHAFGDGNGWENYLYVEEVLWQFPAEQVLPHLLQSLRSRQHSIRYWSAEIAAVFPFPALLSPLKDLLNDPEEDIRFAALRALAWIDDPHVEVVLTDLLSREQVNEVVEFIRQVMADRQKLDFRLISGRLRKEV